MRDTLFNQKNCPIKQFKFDHAVANVFDDMAQRSIPGYKECQVLIQKIMEKLPQNELRVIDLGCSTGELVFDLVRNNISKKIHYTGIDLSNEMIDKANEKLNLVDHQHLVEFIQGNILDYAFDSADIIVLNYTLQFLPPEKRDLLLGKIYASLNWSGIIILSEKVSYADNYFQEMFTHTYYDFKKQQGYSELEIAKKREALENVLITDTEAIHLERLKRSGFKQVESAIKWCNFVSFVGVKQLVQ